MTFKYWRASCAKPEHLHYPVSSLTNFNYGSNLIAVFANAHAWSSAWSRCGAQVFGSPCGCDISEKSAAAILRFPLDSTRTTDQERSRSCAAQANVLWPGTFSASLNDPTWNATARCLWVFFALRVAFDLCRFAARHLPELPRKATLVPFPCLEAALNG